MLCPGPALPRRKALTQNTGQTLRLSLSYLRVCVLIALLPSRGLMEAFSAINKDPK